MPRLVLAVFALALLGADAEGYRRPQDPLFPWQWSLENRGQPVRKDSPQRGLRDADIDATEAFAAGHTGKGITIALIGVGMPYAKSAITDALWYNRREVPDNGVDDDGNGLVDDLVGWDFGANDAIPRSRSAHDLKVAEIAVAPHDHTLTAGVAPGARLMLLRIADDQDRIQTGPLPAAVRYAVRHGARVILLPWTYQGVGCHAAELSVMSNVLKQASRYALVIGGRPGSWPACLPEVVSVQATGPDDRTRNARSTDIDFSAPGSDGRVPVHTSYAIGVVGGAAALLWAQHPDWSPAAVRGRLLQTTDKVNPGEVPYISGRNDLYGTGRINVARALRTDLDGDGVLDSDDHDADGDGVLSRRDPCPLNPDPSCEY